MIETVFLRPFDIPDLITELFLFASTLRKKNTIDLFKT